jgi:hypothetical protein
VAGLSSASRVFGGGRDRAAYAIDSSGAVHRWEPGGAFAPTEHAGAALTVSQRAWVVGTDDRAVQIDPSDSETERSIEGVAQVVDAARLRCARRPDGRVSCRSRDEYEHSRLGPWAEQTELSPAADLVSNGRAVCVRRVDGSIACVDRMRDEPIGSPASHAVETPIEIDALRGARQIAIGEGDSGPYLCGELAEGRVACWGHENRYALTPVEGITGARALAAADSICAMLESGSVRCWGGGPAHEYDGGPATLDVTPVDVGIAVLWDEPWGELVCAREPTDTLRCADRAPAATSELIAIDLDLGLRRDGTVVDLSLCAPSEGPPRCGESEAQAPVPGVRGAQAIAASWWHACALSSRGAISCWTRRSVERQVRANGPPRRIPGLPPAAAIALAEREGCALGRDRRLRCWTFGRPRPRAVDGGERVVRIAGRGGRVCGIRDDRSLACWRYEAGEETDGAWRRVLDDPDARAIDVAFAAYGAAVCVVRADHSVACADSSRLGTLSPATGTSAPVRIVLE